MSWGGGAGVAFFSGGVEIFSEGLGFYFVWVKIFLGGIDFFFGRC